MFSHTFPALNAYQEKHVCGPKFARSRSTTPELVFIAMVLGNHCCEKAGKIFGISQPPSKLISATGSLPVLRYLVNSQACPKDTVVPPSHSQTLFFWPD